MSPGQIEAYPLGEDSGVLPPSYSASIFGKVAGGGRFPNRGRMWGGASSLLSIPSSAPHSWLHVSSTLASALVQSPGLLPWRLTLAVLGL